MAIPTRPPGGSESQHDKPGIPSRLNRFGDKRIESSQEEELGAMPSLEEITLPELDLAMPEPTSPDVSPNANDAQEGSPNEDDDWDSILSDIDDDIYGVVAEEHRKSDAYDSPEPVRGDEELPEPESMPNVHDDIDDWGDLDLPEERSPGASPTDSQIPSEDDWDADDWGDLDENPDSDDTLGDWDETPRSEARPSWDDEPQKFPEVVEDEPSDDDEVTFDDEEEDEEYNDEELEEGESSPAPLKKKGNSRGPHGVLGKLAGIPLLGLIFKPLLGLGKLVSTLILVTVPLLIIALAIFLIALGTAPKPSGATGPDNSAVTIGDVTVDGETISAIVHNEGDVIANVTVELERWTYNPLGGGNIFKFEKQESCSVDLVIDIDANETAQVTCPSEATGILVRGGAHASF